MKLSRTKLMAVPIASIALVGAGTLGVGVASAATASTAHVAMAKHSEVAYEARLARAVKNGKLTSAQEQAILAEHTTLKAEITGTTKDERKAERKAAIKEARAWAKANNVRARWLMGG